MATRIDGMHSERVRQRIRISQLITRLQNHALGRKGVRMTDSQIKAAAIVINKAMSNPPEAMNLNHTADAGLLVKFVDPLMRQMNGSLHEPDEPLTN
jgi:hypothetical protein